MMHERMDGLRTMSFLQSILSILRTCMKERKKYNWHGVEKTIRHVRTVKTHISLCNLIRVFFLYLLDSYILFCGEGTLSSSGLI